MTTQPPSPEAVEAALKWLQASPPIDKQSWALLYNSRNTGEQISETVRRIIAAEIERLLAERDEMKRRWHNSRRACRQQGKGLQLHARIMQLQAAETMLMRHGRDVYMAEARQLRAEVERLHAQVALLEQNNEAAQKLVHEYHDEKERLRAKEDEGCEWRPQGQDGENGYMANCGQWWHWHFNLTSRFCPGCGRKVKIQPQTNDEQ